MGENESATPKLCPLLSGLEPKIVSLPSYQKAKELDKEKAAIYVVKEVICYRYGCEFWSKKEEVCSFVRKVEYETLLEKIIQSKK